MRITMTEEEAAEFNAAKRQLADALAEAFRLRQIAEWLARAIARVRRYQ